MLRLVLLRHGEPEKNAIGRCYGKLDIGLSRRGRDQVRLKLKLLKALKADALYISPRKRSLESALIASKKLRLQPRVVPELCEINFGEFEGQTYEEIERLFPAEYKSWMEHPTEITFPGGESFSAMKQRVLAFTSALPDLHRRRAVVMISHGGVNRIILADALGLPDPMLFRIDQAYAGLSIIDYYAQHPVVKLLNA